MPTWEAWGFNDRQVGPLSLWGNFWGTLVLRNVSWKPLGGWPGAYPPGASFLGWSMDHLESLARSWGEWNLVLVVFFLGGGKFQGLELSWFIGFNFFRFFFKHICLLATWQVEFLFWLEGWGGLVMSNSRRLVFYSYDKGWLGWQGALTEPKNLPIDWFWFGFFVFFFWAGLIYDCTYIIYTYNTVVQ